MRGLVLWLALASCSCTRWTKRDTALELAFVGVTAIDWRQTITIAGDCHEANPMIGRCGNVITPNIYFPIVLVIHAAVAATLPRPWREIFQSFTTGIEGSTIYTNHLSKE